jgi:hypothetical protein
MKKYAKKLSLNRETLRHLQSGEVMKVAGASVNCTSVVCVEYSECECPSVGSCGTECYSPTQCFWGCSISAETCRC